MMIAEDLQSNPKYVTDGINSAGINRHYRSTQCRLCESSGKCYLFEDDVMKIYICANCYKWIHKKMENRKAIEGVADY